MSERTGNCPLCEGFGCIARTKESGFDECGRCGGTGFDGSYAEYPWQQNYKESTRRPRLSSQFALEHALAAMLSLELKRSKKKKAA